MTPEEKKWEDQQWLRYVQSEMARHDEEQKRERQQADIKRNVDLIIASVGEELQRQRFDPRRSTYGHYKRLEKARIRENMAWRGNRHRRGGREAQIVAEYLAKQGDPVLREIINTDYRGRYYRPDVADLAHAYRSDPRKAYEFRKAHEFRKPRERRNIYNETIYGKLSDMPDYNSFGSKLRRFADSFGQPWRRPGLVSFGDKARRGAGLVSRGGLFVAKRMSPVGLALTTADITKAVSDYEKQREAEPRHHKGNPENSFEVKLLRALGLRL